MARDAGALSFTGFCGGVAVLLLPAWNLRRRQRLQLAFEERIGFALVEAFARGRTRTHQDAGITLP